MGGRGSKSNISTPTVRLQAPPQPQQPRQQAPISQQPPTAQNTPVMAAAITALSQMTDAQLAQLVLQSRGIDMPNQLKDAADRTQEFVYAAGLNEKPLVLDDAAFAQYLKDNGIPTSQIISRSVNPITYRNSDGTRVTLTASDVIDMMKYSRLNYVGGKHGGQVYGAGTYFDMNGGRGTGYGSTGSKTAIAALNPATAKVISDTALRGRAAQFAQSHPQFARAVGSYSSSTMSIYALAMGYNVIQSGSYHNVIDRSALVYRKSDQ